MSNPTAVAAPAPEPEGDPWAGSLPNLPALDFTHLLPERSAQDILAAEVHVTFGRKPEVRYTLPVLSIAENREWKANLEGGLVALLSTIDEMDDMGGIMAAFTTVSPQLLQAIIEYDVDAVLPPLAVLERQASDPQVLRAVLAIWSAANPFAQVAVAAMQQAPDQLVPATAAPPASTSSTPTNGRRRSTAGRRATSRKN